MSSPVFTPQRRLLRTSNPSPPEREDIAKRLRPDMLTNTDFDSTVMSATTETIHAIMPQHFTISDEDIQKIADAVKATIMTDIDKLIISHTKPLKEEINKLKHENRKLKEQIDSVEQYGRRSLIRLSGIPEPEREGDTTEIVREIISNIDPNYREEDIIRSHRVGKRATENERVNKPRQIIVRLSEPSVKFRILKSGKNLKKIPNYKSVYINEDLTLLRSKLLYHCRQLQKKKKISKLWTTNGKICLKDNQDEFHDASTPTRFANVVAKLEPTYEIPPELLE